MNHVVLDISVSPSDPFREILSAELFEIGYEGILETTDGIQAVINETEFNRENLNELLALPMFDKADIGLKKQSLEKQRNWNQEWEDRFEPVVIAGRCLVRAPFNKVQGTFEHELIIQPKMSFGTGHHATTSLMLGFLLDMSMPENLLDMGSGTGVLAIYCKKNGAKNVLAIDIDEWAYTNTRENMALNNVDGIELRHGDSSALKDEKFEVILANINRNVLLHDMPVYADHLTKGGTILFSGFYTEDLQIMKDRASEFNLTFEEHHVQDNWVAARFVLKA